MNTERAMIFSVFVSIFLVIGLSTMGLVGLNTSYILFLCGIGLIIPSLLPFFVERPPTLLVVSSVLFALISLLLLYGGNLSVILNNILLLCCFLLVISVPLMNLRDKMFKSESDVRP